MEAFPLSLLSRRKNFHTGLGRSDKTRNNLRKDEGEREGVKRRKRRPLLEREMDILEKE